MELYLGIDVSTQGIKAVVIDVESGEIISRSSVNFGRELSKYHSPQGFLQVDDPLVRHADPLMWLEGVELVLKKLVVSGTPMQKIRGISGVAQQHGSVYLSSLVAPWEDSVPLVVQMKKKLARKTAPIWMDHSTEKDCRILQEQFGFRMLCTGSSAVERFTGPQIHRFAYSEPDAWKKTVRVHLVSSFLCSVLCGKDCPMDFCDASGMNLLDLEEKIWAEDIVQFTAPDLLKKLPGVVSPENIAGGLDPFFERFHLHPGIPVAVWSGDNFGSMIGTGAAFQQTLGISLGTSDTVFASIKDFATDPEGCGHVFYNPMNGFMSLTCFSNGSFAREKIRDLVGADWKFFDEDACKLSAPGCNGHLMLPWFGPECTPKILSAGMHANFVIEKEKPECVIRCLLESQALAMRSHCRWAVSSPQRIRLTGGASGCQGFQQVLADVFQCPVEVMEISDSAALGGALRAAHNIGHVSYEKLKQKFSVPVYISEPDCSLQNLYDGKVLEYQQFEKMYR